MKKGTSRHPKMKALARNLQVPLPTAIGMLQLLWEFTAEYAPDGAIGKYPDSDIADACGWSGNPEALVSALTSEESRWVDTDDLFRLVVHDWPDHCEDSVHNKLARGKRHFASGPAPKLCRLGKEEKAELDAYYKAHPVFTAREAVDSVRQAHAEQKKAPDVQIRAHDVQLKAHAERTPSAQKAPLPFPSLPSPSLPLPQSVGQQSQPALPFTPVSEFPLTDAAIRGVFPATDQATVRAVVNAAMQAYLSVDHPKIQPPTDMDIAEAVAVALKASPGQKSARLFLSTVPSVVSSWAQVGRGIVLPGEKPRREYRKPEPIPEDDAHA